MQLKRMRLLALSLIAMFLAVGFITGTPKEAEAADLSGFERGFIISDDNMYDGDAMTAAQIQTFLNQKVPRCTLGDPERAKGKVTTWAGWDTRLANDCLKTYKMKTPKKPADHLCKTYQGANSETAAQIIAKVGKACGISQKVLLVTLQKEQSLITDNWPTLKQYEIATGYGCPDSGPNNGPLCSAEYYGLFNQIYNTARQIQNYRYATDYFTWFPVQKTTNIQYSVEKSCGTAKVFIENHATAALYYYTPYTPHDNILQGKTYNCGRASTAQSNFYSLYSDWFEQPNLRVPVYSAFKTYKNTVTWLGNPIDEAKTVTGNGGGTYQEFAKGVIIQSTKGKAVAMRKNDKIYQEYKTQGFGSSQWGWPVASAGCNSTITECAADFTNGNVVWSAKRGFSFTPASKVEGGNNSSKDIVGGEL